MERKARRVPAAKASTAVDAGTGQAPGPAPVRRRPGRPRSELAERAIIDAALSVFAESGPDGLCIEQVAARAGVGKATIYRRWPGKEDLLLDALAALKPPLPQPRGRSVREDLVAVVDAMCRDAADPRRARQFALLQGEGAKYPRLMTRFIETVVEPRREVVRSVLRRGVATGELRDDADIEAALYLLRGAALASTGHQQPVPPDYAEHVVDTLLHGVASH
jgi:AcrR family transcriptional regulator